MITLLLLNFNTNVSAVFQITVLTTGFKFPEEEKKYNSTLSLTSALDGDAWSKAWSGGFTPGKYTQYPFYRRLCGPQRQCGRTQKISRTPGLDPGPSSPYRMFISATLFRSTNLKICKLCYFATQHSSVGQRVWSKANSMFCVMWNYFTVQMADWASLKRRVCVCHKSKHGMSDTRVVWRRQFALFILKLCRDV